METLVQDKLRGILVDHGRRVIDDPLRLESLLRDHCPDSRLQVSALLTAVKERIPYALEHISTNVPREAALANLAQRIQENHGLAGDVARWAVESWAFGLGLTDRIGSKNQPPQVNYRREPPPVARNDVQSLNGSEMAVKADAAALEKANKWIKNASTAAVVNGIQALLLTFLAINAGNESAGIIWLISSVILFCLAAGTAKKNKAAAVIAAAFAGLGVIQSLAQVSAVPSMLIPLVANIFWFYLYVRGVQAIFAFHKTVTIPRHRAADELERSAASSERNLR